MLLTELVTHAQVLITYIPVRNEIDPLPLLPSIEGKDTYVIQPNATLDPYEEARQAITLADGRETVIVVPGTRFDAAGTRHGKGAGWYDRFLSAVPASWARIGFCTTDQFSIESLTRQSWDEPMDYVVVVAEGKTTYYTTHARS